jgi:CRISPR-associated protein Csb1
VNLEKLTETVKTAAALRYRARLQPAGGSGDKVFPPTYEGGKYAEEKRRIEGVTYDCVHLDSVQSQANRMELALLEASREGLIRVPRIEVQFTGDLAEIGSISSLEAPHRLADAILRDSMLKDSSDEVKRYPETSEAKKWINGSVQNASGLFEVGPTALLFGIWFNPTGGAGNKGSLGTKIQRAIVSEVFAVGVERGVKSALRIDPLQIEKGAGPIFSVNAETGEWSLDAGTGTKKLEKVGRKKEGNPSDIVHGNIVTPIDDKNGGVTFEYALQATVISLPALRRLQFRLFREKCG